MRVQWRKPRIHALDIRKRCVMSTTKGKEINMNSEDVLILIGWCMFAAGIAGLVMMEII